jgi:hypothetical protein
VKQPGTFNTAFCILRVISKTKTLGEEGRRRKGERGPKKRRKGDENKRKVYSA